MERLLLERLAEKLTEMSREAGRSRGSLTISSYSHSHTILGEHQFISRIRAQVYSEVAALIRETLAPVGDHRL